jgi:hypothetical protein
MACFLPVRPFALLGPSGLPSLAASIIPFRNERDSPLLHFDATLSVFLLHLPRLYLSHVDHDPDANVPRVSFPALQHFRMKKPFFSPPLLVKAA